MAKQQQGVTRAEFLKSAVVGAMAAGTFPLAAARANQAPRQAIGLTLDDLKGFAKVAGLKFTDAEYAKVLADIDEPIAAWESVRKSTADYTLFPSAPFRVLGADEARGTRVDVKTPYRVVKRPTSDEDLAFMPVTALTQLIKSKQVSSVELTELAIRRLKRYGPKLTCVATLMEERAMRQARLADEALAAGKYHGPLHGIPCGIKDLFATKGYPTQWGTAAFQGQTIDLDAAVVERLDKAGAVICAKLSLGALAMDDKWYGGQTKNPWKPDQGSSGSSAGSASAVSAGLVPFAVGTETSGSIVSPSHRCRVTGLRPTFGSVSRYGAMALCWSLDKVGPLCRTAEDAALVFAALVGHDPRDGGTIHRPFEYRRPKDLKGRRIGVLGKPLAKVQDELKGLGAILDSIQAPGFSPALYNILAVESAAMFDEITRNGRLNLVTENGWPEYWRSARFIPAVEFAQAERARTLLMREWDRVFGAFDLILAADHGGGLIYPANLTGWPQVLVPMGADEKGVEVSVSLLAKPFAEGQILGAAVLLQDRLPYHKARPDLRAFG